jgi:cytochrome-b5 reductase
VPLGRAAGSSSSSVLTISPSATTLSLPLRRRFATNDEEKKTNTGSEQQQSHKSGGGGSNLGMVLGLGAVLAGGYVVSQMLGGDKAAPEKQTATPATPPPVALNKDEFLPFQVTEVEDLTPNTRRVRFALPSKEHVLGLPIASCVVTRAPIGEGGKEVIRPYTPVTNDKLDKGYFDFIVKTYPTGVMSSHIYNLKVGDKLEVKGPIAKLPYTKNMKKHLAMLAGGTGITPMLQVIEEVLSEKEDQTHVSLVFANNAEEDIILKDRLDQLAKKHPNFEVHYVVLKPTSSWKGHTGFITPDIIKKHVPGPSEDVMVLVCGPPPFYNALSGPKDPDYSQGELSGALKDLGYTKEQVFKF